MIAGSMMLSVALDDDAVSYDMMRKLPNELSCEYARLWSVPKCDSIYRDSTCDCDCDSELEQ